MFCRRFRPTFSLRKKSYGIPKENIIKVVGGTGTDKFSVSEKLDFAKQNRIA